ncbi:DUF4132 domain-containing protein [Serratia sp. (in: enterobacteria)]|uniref:DUF4132 domain-containing protein n=1 Tax=Serratia sp. (in: enterobacteria) TaxID=616 RepID=UPI003989320D
MNKGTTTPPWLADDALPELTFKKGKIPLSHRRWPGEAVPPLSENRIQQLANVLPKRFSHFNQPNWLYSHCQPEWQQAIAQAISLIGATKPSIPARTMAALTRIAEDNSRELLDEIVQQEGIEYATEVVIERQSIAIDYVNSNQQTPDITFTFTHQDRSYLSETYNEFDLRLRKHLSQAQEDIWQRCADKLIAALPAIQPTRRPFIALLLPELPEIANEIAGLTCNNSSLHAKEWLKAVATAPEALAALEEYWTLDVFNDREASYMSRENHHGYAACAALLREQGLAAVPRLAPYAHRDDCGSLLVQINHPQVIRMLLLVADKNKPSQERVSKFSKKFPAATLVALAELLTLNVPPARPGYPGVEAKKLPQQQKKQKESWRARLQTLLNLHPQLIEQLTPWLSAQALALLHSFQQPSSLEAVGVADSTNLPEILLSPPWHNKKKKAASPYIDLPALAITPQEYWQQGEREALATSSPARFFNDIPLLERLTHKGDSLVLRELGFEDMDYLFHQYTLHGQQRHFESRQGSDWDKSTANALRSGDNEALLQAWRNHLDANYKPNDSWNLYLLSQLPHEQALALWQRINEENFNFVGADYLLSRLGTDALPGLLLALQHHPKDIFPLLLNFGATELVLPMARAWRRFQARRNLARQWLLQWQEHAASALIPLALDKVGDNREAAINALRLLHKEGHADLLHSVALRWNVPELWTALAQLLTQDPHDIYPARVPKAPDFWQPTLWRRPRLCSNNQPLPDDAMEILGEMLRFTHGSHYYIGLDRVKEVCQTHTLAAFAWDLFSAWQNAGAPTKENWAFHTLGIFGDESTTRELTPLIMAWPQEGKSARAASGLNLLTQIGSDMALLQLHHISQRAKSRPLRDNAEQSLQEVAEARDLSEEKLQDRLTPTLGLDNPQALNFDFGSRSFRMRLDENLQPVIYDSQDVRQKTIPRLRADDDQLKASEALARLKGLKKDITQTAKRLLPHLESALRLARRWKYTEFQSLFVDHPFTRHLTQRLVWGIYAPNEPRRLLSTFRVAAEGEFCDAQDEPITLPPDALFGIAHPLEMSAEMREAYAQLFIDYELIAPFRQLTRRTVLLTPQEAAHSQLTRWQGKSAACGHLLWLRSQGWQLMDNNYFCYVLPQHQLILEISPGFPSYNIDAKAEMSFTGLTLYCDGREVPFAGVDERALSEALSSPDIIFHS